MKQKEYKPIVDKVAARIPGSSAKGRLVFLQPVGHTLRGILLEGSVNPRGFYANLFVQPLFVPAEHHALNFGWRLGGGTHLWDVDNPQDLSELQALVEREAGPFLSRIQSPQDVAAAAEALRKPGDLQIQQARAYAYAYAGDVERGSVALTELIERLDESIPWHHEMAKRASKLRGLLQSSPDSAKQLLVEWERETARRLKLDAR